MKNLKQRVLTGWTFLRFLYLGLGSAFIINSIMTEQWFGAAFGAYFAWMGIFAFGCASGNCYVPPSSNSAKNSEHTNDVTVEFEEVKGK